jgi:HAD superfamily hydrolase (TIGR01458 family)
MESVRALLVDIDGVLTVSWRPLPGAVEALREIREAGLAVLLVTNTTSRTRASIAGTLADAGFPVSAGDILTAPAATAAYLAEHCPGARCALLNSGDIAEDLDGVTVVDAADSSAVPDVVLVGGAGPEFGYAALDRAFGHLQRGARLVAMHRNLYWRTAEGLRLDSGAFLAGLEQAARVEAEITGKPSRAFFEAALARVGAGAGEAVMVGDDVESDVLAAQRAGVTGVLVRTGKFQPEDLRAADDRRRDDQLFEQPLVDLVDRPLAEERAGHDEHHERQVEQQGAAVDQTQTGAEGQLGDVDDQEEEGGRAEEAELAEARGQQVHRHHRAARVGDHGGEAAEDAVGAGLHPARAAGDRLGLLFRVGRTPAPDGHPGHQQQDRSDRGPYDRVVRPHQEHRADDDARGDRREQPPQRGPVGVPPVGGDGEQVTGDQNRQQHAGGGTGGQHRGEDGEADRVGPAHGGLRETDEQGREGECGELPAGDVPERHRVHASTDAMCNEPGLAGPSRRSGIIGGRVHPS